MSILIASYLIFLLTHNDPRRPLRSVGSSLETSPTCLCVTAMNLLDVRSWLSVWFGLICAFD